LNQDDPIYSKPRGKAGFDTGGNLPELETDAFVQRFSLKEKTNGAYVDGDLIWTAEQQHKDTGGFMPISQIAIPGQHNLQNTLAAVLACRYLEIPDEDIRDSIASFRGVEHRLEHIAQLDGADWYNDSKATNINAAWYALSSFSRPIIWLAGGQGDGNDYHALETIVRERVKNVIAFGQDSYDIHSTYSSMVACDRVDDMQEAVQLAASLAEEGDIVLLSPACKSFDQFLNFEDRGRKFKAMVSELL
jgi:UDP-N-acetylmuramoylalanine--D-glutamate ligase